MTNPDEPAASEPPVIDHDPSAPAPDPVTPPPERPRAPVRVRGGGSNVLTIVLCGALAGGLYYVWANPRPSDDQAAIAALRRQVQADADQIAAVQSAVQSAAQNAAQAGAQSLGPQLQALADRVDKLEKAAANAPAAVAAPADLGDLPKRVDDLSAKVDALAQRPAEAAGGSAPAADNGATQQAIEELGRRVAQSLDAEKAAVDADKTALEGQKAALEAQQAALNGQKSAVEQLGGRLDKLEKGAGQSIGTTDRVVRLTRVQAALVALDAGQKLGDVPNAPPAVTRFAKQAPPTEVALREAFPALAAHAREVSRPDISHRSFFERALTRLQQSVTVRQGDDVLVGDPAAGILAEAETKVEADDLAGAVASLGKLQGPAAEAVKDWVDQARALLAARAALADLAAHS